MNKMWKMFAILIILSACTKAPGFRGDGTLANPPEKTAATPMIDTTTAPQNLTVFAAASLAGAFDEIGNNFETSNPNITVKFNFAGSQTLRSQIEQGAYGDVFASANSKEMDTLVSDQYVDINKPQLFASNQLVVIMPANNPAGINELSDLSRPGIKIVLAASEVPVGNYSLQVLEKLDSVLGNSYKANVLGNVVSYENDVKQVLAKVQLGEADAGIVYVSDSVSAPDLQKISIPIENNVIAQYPVAVLKSSKNPDLANAFISYLLSKDEQEVLIKWGFTPVNNYH